MRYFAYCPLSVPKEKALELAKSKLQSNKVVKVDTGFDGQYIVEILDFKGNRADFYGYDLHLYSIDDAGNLHYIDAGGFR